MYDNVYVDEYGRTFFKLLFDLIQALSTRIRIRLKTQLFFSPFSEKFATTRSVFASFSPAHTYTVNPVLSPPSLISAPPPFQRRKVNKPFLSIKRPPSPSSNPYSSQKN